MPLSPEILTTKLLNVIDQAYKQGRHDALEGIFIDQATLSRKLVNDLLKSLELSDKDSRHKRSDYRTSVQVKPAPSRHIRTQS